MTWDLVSCRFPILNPFQGLQKDQNAERKTFLSQNIWPCFGFQQRMLAGHSVCLQLSGLLLGSVPTPACRTMAISSKMLFSSFFARWLGLTCDHGKHLQILSEKVSDIRVISPHLSPPLYRTLEFRAISCLPPDSYQVSQSQTVRCFPVLLLLEIFIKCKSKYITPPV